MVAPLGRICGFSVQGVCYVLHEEGTIVFEVRAQVGGHRTNGLIDDDPVTIAAPGAGASRKQRKTHGDRGGSVKAPSQWIEERPPHFKIALSRLRRARRSYPPA